MLVSNPIVFDNVGVRGGQGNQFSESNSFVHASAVLVRLLWSWPVVIVFSTALLVAVWQVFLGFNQFFAALVAFVIATLFLFGKIYSWLPTQFVRRRTALNWARSIVIIVMLALDVEHWNIVQGREKQIETIRVGFVGEFVFGGGDTLFSAFLGTHGQQLTPVNILLFSSITNSSDNEIRLISFSLEYKESWRRWKPLELVPNDNLFWANNGDLSKANQVRIPNVTAESLEGSIQPHHEVETYHAFQVPRGAPPNWPLTPMRLRACDVNNLCVFSDLPMRTNGAKGGAAGPQMQLQPQVVDLRGIYRSPWDGRL